MKKVLGTTGIFVSIVLIATMVRWDYIIYFMNLSFQAVEQIVAGAEIPQEFQETVADLSIGQFINVPFWDEYMQENEVRDKNGEYITFEKTIEMILEEE